MKYVYMVMDSRAQFDIDRAAILECCGNELPSWKTLRKDWGEQGAVLIRYPLIWGTKNDYDYDGDSPEIVGVIN